MRHLIIRSATAALLLFALCACRAPADQQQSSSTSPVAPLSGRVTTPHAEPDDGTWQRPAKDFASTRFSGLTQLTAESVRGLTVKATFSTGFTRGHEAAPLVVNNTMYVVTPFPNVLYALDLTKPGLPLKWKFEPKPKSSAQGVACCDVVNRGASFANGLIVINTLDNRTVAVDAATGQAKWDTLLGDIGHGETMTMAPLIVKDKVFVGNSGGEMGVRGWLTALDLMSGRQVWRAYSTGPDTDVLIGPRFKPYYAAERGTDLGIHSWPGETWKQGGGAPWG